MRSRFKSTDKPLMKCWQCLLDLARGPCPSAVPSRELVQACTGQVSKAHARTSLLHTSSDAWPVMPMRGC